MVTPGSRSAKAKASGITRTHPPTQSGPRTSIRWGSKVKEMQVAVIASSSGENAVRSQAKKAARLARLIRDPFRGAGSSGGENDVRPGVGSQAWTSRPASGRPGPWST